MKYAALVLIVLLMPLAMADEVDYTGTPSRSPGDAICSAPEGYESTPEGAAAASAMADGGVSGVYFSTEAAGASDTQINYENRQIYTFWCGADGYGGVNRALNSPVVGLPLFMPLGVLLLIGGVLYKDGGRSDLAPEGMVASLGGFMLLLLYIPCYL